MSTAKTCKQNKNIITTINKILKKNYPLQASFDTINNLSHFWILSNNYNKFLTIQMNIQGVILSGQYKNYHIIKVITSETINWNNYLSLYTAFINKSCNPCINEKKFMSLIHTGNYIDILNIKKLLIKNKQSDTILEYTVEYSDTSMHKLPQNNYIIDKKDNHFYFDSFSVDNNYQKLKVEMDRLIKNRNAYSSIHFHLNNNVGGDIVPAHIILRCLTGMHELWMKPIKKILKNGKPEEWNCWKEENKESPNYSVVKKLNLNTLPTYTTKYNGKIYLHMDKKNGSAAWFFITYLIYSFSNKINRFFNKCYGQIIKYGSIESDQLCLLNHSGTTSGDGNNISVKNNKIEILCPTEQFISCSVKKNDWNRFWIENK